MAKNDHRIVKRLVSRLPDANGSSIRRGAQALLDGVGFCPADIHPLIEGITFASAERWREYVVACWVLSEIRPDRASCGQAVAALTAIIDERAPVDWQDNFVRTCSRTAAGISVVLGVASGVWSFVGLTSQAGNQAVGPQTEGLYEYFTNVLSAALVGTGSVILAFAIFFFVIASAVVVAPRFASARQGEANSARVWAARALGRWREVRGLGALARGSAHASLELRDESRAALAEVLGAVQSSDYRSVSARDQKDLALLLQSDVPSATKVAILRALGHIGGAAVETLVAALAADGVSEELAVEARAVLPGIEQRASMERNSSNLLRASHSAYGGITLVRPAATDQVDAAVLVRPASSSSASNT